ncbi:TPA: hypothetical protein DIC20_02215 [Candidatus Dependentiae bacterium]|nr:MAG: hypothetical protein US03_C0003G0004 [candidate division TM6 bacterium GW2011_GWF2_36_131]KKQ03323.1 MAG: hypothetical protein US13_C0003G0004 [candidate division TM6 bacterium GW2011_GWE2_36_25]KKQ19719.1 MAG: hypothetical protein US32_C0005G0003 [candidate division TM6 bacterium GW2011_GWA2_36_9]HBR70898.1 hypothetical protein [Candidatus Dependentiae bacterium]HCU00499.1 hypothetical protein [Candidatus Dependentiae bacterium]
MKSSVLALVLLVSSSAIAMERAKKAVKWVRDEAGVLVAASKNEVVGRAGGVYDAGKGRLFAVPGQVTGAVKGAPGFVKDEAGKLYSDTRDSLQHPVTTLRGVSGKAFTVAKWSALLGGATYMIAEVLEILGSTRS